MGDILSQNEIDELLKALTTGDIDVQQIQTTKTEKKVKLHDFKKPPKFANDHKRTLQFINENYARLVQTFLSGYLRSLVQVDVLSVDALQYSEFSNSLANPVVLGIVDFSPLNGSVIFEMDPSIAYSLIDRILGGRGSAMERVRSFTEIELAILERIIIQILNLMREPWESIISIKPRLEKIETNAQFAQIIHPNEMVALITLNVVVGEVKGMINICIPHMTVEPIMPKLSTKLWFTNIENEKTEHNKQDIEFKIENTLVPVRAVLGKTVINIGEFLDLQKGDVLPLETSINGDLEILVGDLPKFLAKPGVKKNKIAVKITEVIRREEE
ncbi:flagellar motor switch protein FliM [Ruminiclostridium cellobioparum]|uniref:Flagellar motor switch protein FliM n=1 Tax=Ruminiclostridium cellobioparum subsp. termitidis CT1112 TaxID=1195236 RepID=S0FI29_RUMCE|nr:flagellar motor switch protein FliM [Ruminiclostridium cellobioparum]EMS71515.1 flagellar motor switch protein FliM [Ruminiclostridium cellobioparum subsp. termitidis CT1112]